MMLALALLTVGFAAMLIGFCTRRPGLLLLGASIAVCHALPLVMLDTDASSATMRAEIGTVIAIAGIASFSWCAGYWLLARQDAVPSGIQTTGAPPYVAHGVVLVLLVGLIAAAPGGVSGFAQAGFLRLPVDSTLFSLTYATACLAGFTTALILVHAVAGRHRLPWLSMGLVLLVFWLLGGRTQLAITALAFCLVLLAHGRMRLRGLVLPGVALALMAALTLSFRLRLQGEETGLGEALPMMLSQISLLEGYALAARFVEEFGFRGSHYFETVQQMLPRALFPDKPLQLSKALRLMEARDTLGGLTPGLPGEAFATAGLVGVAAVGLGFGGALALLDNACRCLSEHSFIAQALVVSLIPLLAIFVLRGGFDTAVFRLVILIAAGFMAAWWQGTHGKSKPVGIAS